MKLRLEDLTVDTFATQALPTGRGTVHGHETQEAVTCGNQTCGQWSCNGTCEDSEWYQCEGQSVGLSACCPTNGCTNDPLDAYCYDSMNFCVQTRLQTCVPACG